MQYASRESLDGGTRVTEQHTSGAVAVQQVLHQ